METQDLSYIKTNQKEVEKKGRRNNAINTYIPEKVNMFSITMGLYSPDSR